MDAKHALTMDVLTDPAVHVLQTLRQIKRLLLSASVWMTTSEILRLERALMVHRRLSLWLMNSLALGAHVRSSVQKTCICVYTQYGIDAYT